MWARHHGDFVLISPGCLSAERGGRERDGTKRGTPLTLITAGHEGSQRRGQFGRLQWGFPCLWLDVMIGSVSVLAIFVLPLNLSVNILLIRTIEILLELFVRSVLSYAANKSDTSDSYHDTLVWNPRRWDADFATEPADWYCSCADRRSTCQHWFEYSVNRPFRAANHICWNNMLRLLKGAEEAGWGLPDRETLNPTQTDGWKVLLLLFRASRSALICHLTEGLQERAGLMSLIQGANSVLKKKQPRCEVCWRGAT